MNYREKMRSAVSSPYDGSAIKYGDWGALRPNQRRDILRLLDEMDRADEYIKRLYFQNEKLISIIQTLIKEFNLEPTEYTRRLMEIEND